MLAPHSCQHPAITLMQPPMRHVQEREIAPVIAGYWEKAEFPFPLVPGFQASAGS